MVADVPLTGVLGLEPGHVVSLPLLLLLVDTATPEVVLLRLDAVLMLEVVEFISAVLEVDIFVDEIELVVLSAEVEVVTCVLDAEAEVDVERETVELFKPVLFVSVILVPRVVRSKSMMRLSDWSLRCFVKSHQE